MCWVLFGNISFNFHSTHTWVYFWLFIIQFPFLCLSNSPPMSLAHSPTLPHSESCNPCSQSQVVLHFRQAVVPCPRAWARKCERRRPVPSMTVSLPDGPVTWLLSCCSLCTTFMPGSPFLQVILWINSISADLSQFLLLTTQNPDWFVLQESIRWHEYYSSCCVTQEI